MEPIQVDRLDSSMSSKLKCKPCRLFFKDNGYDGQCPECGGDLNKIRVHRVKVKNLKVIPNMPKVGSK